MIERIAITLFLSGYEIKEVISALEHSCPMEDDYPNTTLHNMLNTIAADIEQQRMAHENKNSKTEPLDGQPDRPATS